MVMFQVLGHADSFIGAWWVYRVFGAGKVRRDLRSFRHRRYISKTDGGFRSIRAGRIWNINREFLGFLLWTRLIVGISCDWLHYTGGV